MTDADSNDLRLLVRLHYGLAVLTALFPLVTIPLLAASVELLTPAASQAEASSGAAFAEDSADQLWQDALAKIALGGVAAIAAVCLVHAVVLGYIARQIASRRRWRLVMVFSALHLINVPLGTALSIFTFVVLGRSGVKEAFVQR